MCVYVGVRMQPSACFQARLQASSKVGWGLDELSRL